MRGSRREFGRLPPALPEPDVGHLGERNPGVPRDRPFVLGGRPVPALGWLLSVQGEPTDTPCRESATPWTRKIEREVRVLWCPSYPLALASDHDVHFGVSDGDHFLASRHRSRLLSGDGIKVETVAAGGPDRDRVPGPVSCLSAALT